MYYIHHFAYVFIMKVLAPAIEWIKPCHAIWESQQLFHLLLFPAEYL